MNYFRPLIRLGLVLLLTSVAASVPGRVLSAAPTLVAPRIALGSPDGAASIPGIYGPIHYGPDFGITMTKDNFTYFNSQVVAIQSVLSGQSDIVGVPFASNFLLRDSGQDFRVFCLRNGGSDTLLVGRNGITKIEQLLDPNTRVAIDSPGGTADVIVNALFQVHGLNATTKDLKNARILEGAADRLAAIEANQVDATVISLNRFRDLQKQTKDAVIISKTYEEMPLYLSATYSAPAQWLDDHLDVATAFCASIIKAQRALVGNYDLFKQAINEFVANPPDESSLKETWDLIVTNDSCRLKGGLDPQSAVFMGDILTKIKVLKQPPDLDTVFDLRPYQMALKLLPAVAAEATAQATADVATP